VHGPQKTHWTTKKVTAAKTTKVWKTRRTRTMTMIVTTCHVFVRVCAVSLLLLLLLSLPLLLLRLVFVQFCCRLPCRRRGHSGTEMAETVSCYRYRRRHHRRLRRRRCRHRHRHGGRRRCRRHERRWRTGCRSTRCVRCGRPSTWPGGGRQATAARA
jgi:hypothetical protein